MGKKLGVQSGKIIGMLGSWGGEKLIECLKIESGCLGMGKILGYLEFRSRNIIRMFGSWKWNI